MGTAQLLVGVASFVINALPLLWQTWKHVRRQAKYHTLQSSFEDASGRLTRMLDRTQDPWEQTLSLLEIGDLLMPQVRARFWRRFTYLLGAAFASAIVVAAVVALIGVSGAAFVLIVAGVAGLNWSAAFNRVSKYLLTDEEQAFFKNAALLQDRFYRHVVVDVVNKFNLRCATVLATERGLAESDWQALRKGLVQLLRLPEVTSGSGTGPAA